MKLRTDGERRNAWHIEPHWGRIHILQEIFEWVKERLTTEELKNEMLLRTDCEVRMPDTLQHIVANQM